jgi:hypothetical protein
MRAAAPVGGAQGFSGGAVRGTPVEEEASLGGQGSGNESRAEWTTSARWRGGDGGKNGGNSSPVCTLYSRARRWTESGTAVKPGAAISGGGRGWNGVDTVWAPTFGQWG